MKGEVKMSEEKVDNKQEETIENKTDENLELT